ncbi:MAG: D-alanyl-D-alanine carboxypeptidase [Firmicutes bacterium]|jgi:D-alanyl-D-alanine carboxypeptidase (penicillin-binding protein 5/6)|nr:D-alanyl-D-alanine carboxypeptidase [Bacillota bacterium]
MKKCLSIVLALLLFCVAFPAAAQDFASTADYAVLMEAKTGQILYEKNGDVPRPPASITKIMTLLLAFEALERGDIAWDQTTIVSERAWRIEGSEMFLEVDTEVTVEELISGISIVSANDGCVAIAELIAGSEDAFVARMNKRAKELGLQNTNFRNSTGLPADNHYMSAKDIAVLARELINRFPKILEFESQREYTYGGIKQYNHNPLLGRFEGADGLKTGWTPESGYSLVGTAVRNNMRLISVVLNMESNEARLLASQSLLSHGFTNFELAEVAKAGTVYGELPVKDGSPQTVSLTVAENYETVIPRDSLEELEYKVTEEKTLAAPVEAGTEAATLELVYEGKTVASTPLITVDAVKKANIFVRLFRSLINFIKSLF